MVPPVLKVLNGPTCIKSVKWSKLLDCCWWNLTLPGGVSLYYSSASIFQRLQVFFQNKYILTVVPIQVQYRKPTFKQYYAHKFIVYTSYSARQENIIIMKKKKISIFKNYMRSSGYSWVPNLVKPLVSYSYEFRSLFH